MTLFFIKSLMNFKSIHELTEFKLVKTTYLSEVKLGQLMFAPPAANGLVYVAVTLSLDVFSFAETAMGQNINAQGDSDSDYVKAVYE